MEGEARNNKRSRDESPESPETKRLRETDIIIEILDADDPDVDPPVDYLADVIKILEEEIAEPATEEVNGSPQMDLGYLLEASDDELGLPPAVGSLSCSPSTDVVDVVEAGDEEPETAWFDRIWGFDDEISSSPYWGMEFGIQTESDDGGLFYYSDAVFEPSDYEDLSWRTESPPAI